MPTWATSQQLVRVLPQGRGEAPAPAATSPTPRPSAQPTATPTAQPTTPTPATPTPATRPSAPTSPAANAAARSLPPVQTFTNQTVRMILRSSIGGRRAQVKLANAFNGTAVEIGAAHIATRDKDSGIVAGSDRALTFGGRQTITMAPGMVVVSDPVDLAVAPLSDVAVSLYFRKTQARRPRTRTDCVRPTSRAMETFRRARPSRMPRRGCRTTGWRPSKWTRRPARRSSSLLATQSPTARARRRYTQHVAGNSGDPPGADRRPTWRSSIRVSAETGC